VTSFALGFPATLAAWIFPIRPAPRTATRNILETPANPGVNQLPSPTALDALTQRALV
jgi:hypothetical protein